MSRVIPEGWEEKELSLITNRISEKTEFNDQYEVLTSSRSGLFKQSEYFNKKVTSSDNSGYRVIAPGQFTFRTMSDDGTFKFNRSSYSFKGIISPAYEVFEAKNCVPEFLDYIMNSYEFHKQIYAKAQGGTRLALKYESLSKFKIICPPLQEQKKIASIINSVDVVIENTQQQIDKLQDQKKATINEFLTKGIDHTEFKDSELGKIPKSWEVKSIRQVAANVNDKFFPFNNNSVAIKYIGLEHIQSETNMIITIGSSGDVVSTKTVFKEKDILFGRLRPYLKKVVIVPFSGICSTDILVIRATKIIIPQFLFCILSTDNTIRYTMEGAAGNIMPRTSWKELKEFRFGLPPLSEQQKIASMFTLIDKTIEERQRKLSKIKSLKKSLMQDLLTGKVRVRVN